MEINNSSILSLLLFSSILSFSANATTIHAPRISPFAAPTVEQIPIFHFPHPPSSQEMVVDPSLKAICAVTSNPTKCVSCLAPFLAGSPTDAVTVLNMFIEAIYKHVERSISLLKKETKKPSLLPAFTASLDMCIDSYDKIKIELVKVEDACTAHDVDTAASLLSSTISKFGQCDESFHQNGMRESPMREIDEMLIELVGFAVDISQKLIKKRKH